MLQSRPSKDAEANRPAPTYFSKEQVADYLNDLRKNRTPRPSGARPLPNRNSTSSRYAAAKEVPARTESAMAVRPEKSVDIGNDRSASAAGHRRAQSAIGTRDEAGRPLVKHPYPSVKARDFSEANTTTSATNETNGTNLKKNPSSSRKSESKRYSIPYYERGQRWMERQEANSLKRALEEKDRREEMLVHEAAQKEASELVWKHRNPQDSGVPYKNPDLDYRNHLRKGSHARSQSIGPYSTLHIKKGGSDGSRSASDGSNSSGDNRKVSSGSNSSADTEDERAGRQLHKVKGYGSLKDRFSIGGPRALIRRRSSSAKGRKASDESHKGSLFRNPNDHIYEEPEEAVAIILDQQNSVKPLPLTPKPRNTSYGSRAVRDKSPPSDDAPTKMVSSVDIHKNPPSQSRNAFYTRNDNATRLDTPPEPVPMKDGKEVRNDDIRAATSMKIKDRSEKLPMPTVVSDRPGRPIVSFADDYQPREKESKPEPAADPLSDVEPNGRPSSVVKPPMPLMASEPVVPTINVIETPSIQVSTAPSIQVSAPPAVPVINISDDNIPSLVVSAPSISIDPPVSAPVLSPAPSQRPLPSPSQSSRPQPGNRPLPNHSTTAPLKSTPHWSPATTPVLKPSHYGSASRHRGATARGATAQCAACALPIAGRVVRAAETRFHPECFSCYTCGTLLECVEFYTEPRENHLQRVHRIRLRGAGREDEIPEDQIGQKYSEMEDGDESVRFYCHLDFHETFSPRCRNCDTPIEGEVILACGGAWHQGHFFCAECGDPFAANTPFVERDGFAWCVGCHTNRFSGKCAGCKKPVIGTVVKALDREWHEDCFVCCECGGGFEGGSFFVRENGELGGFPVCKGCEERRLKA